MSDRLLELEAVTAGYDGPAVIRGIDLVADAGQVIGIFGANGAGKTTTLRVASGLLTPLAGRVRLRGEDVTGQPAQSLARAGVAHVPEGRGIFSGLTVEEHLRLGPPGVTLDRDHAYDLFPALRPLARRRAGLLSGGEQQMLSLGRALARRPGVLLVDELSLGLAPIIVERLLPIVRAFADAGGAVLLVEQHISLALRVVDRAYVLSHGDLALTEDAAALRNDRELILTSYMGEQM